jgi:hypothetical protein
MVSGATFGRDSTNPILQNKYNCSTRKVNLHSNEIRLPDAVEQTVILEDVLQRPDAANLPLQSSTVNINYKVGTMRKW